MTTIPDSFRSAHCRTRWWIGIVVGTALSLGLAGCGSQKAAPPSSTNPTFTLSEYGIKLDRAALPSGSITLTANNSGSEEHEIVLVKASAVANLPTKTDGSVDEDKIPESDKVGEIGNIAAHSSKSAPFQLKPGRYVAFCNIVDTMGTGMMNGSQTTGIMNGMGSGHVHFALGMHQIVTVN